VVSSAQEAGWRRDHYCIGNACIPMVYKPKLVGGVVLCLMSRCVQCRRPGRSFVRVIRSITVICAGCDEHGEPGIWTLTLDRHTSTGDKRHSELCCIQWLIDLSCRYMMPCTGNHNEVPGQRRATRQSSQSDVAHELHRHVSDNSKSGEKPGERKILLCRSICQPKVSFRLEENLNVQIWQVANKRRLEDVKGWPIQP
jgi:hypothetical protein